MGRPSGRRSIDVPREPVQAPTGILPPSAPGGFTAELTPNNDVQFTWTEPERAARAGPVQGYLVYEVRSGGGVRILNLDSMTIGSLPDPVDALTYLHSPAPPSHPLASGTALHLLRSPRCCNNDARSSGRGCPPPIVASVSHFDDLARTVQLTVPLSIPHVTCQGGSERADP